MGLFNRPMNDRERQRWERSRAAGRKRFVVFRGVLGWGVPVAVVWSIWMQLWDNGFSLDGFLSARFCGWTAIALIVFPACGILFGRWMSWSNERRYLQVRRTEGRP